MTREQYVMWMEAHDCDPEPFEGINITSRGICYVNRHNTEYYTIIMTPINDREMPDRVIRDCCDQLKIPYPDCVVIKTKEKK